jgi:hypothetical protein
VTAVDEVAQYGHTKVYRDPGHDTYVVSDHGTWLPGIYATEEAARLAVDVPDTVLAERTHWRHRGVGENYRPVTAAELKEWVGNP